ncbi:MAG: RlmE family RNA methyltransferase [Candidatus Thermoplasmatota archaeon]|nr:RlmE family RNA methyltransferase [Candidatus Thermoplasmatota archaeon]|tara:strand:+ start:4549 stop:5289 length:741 start_codon:yes stop_codon:yes gene_type:complete
MSKRWYQENKRDPWRRDAKSKGYRARSAYKLKQINEKFGLLRNGDVVLDIGCHPGGWTQVAVEEVGDSGFVIGVDLLASSPVEGAEILVGDIRDSSTLDEISELLGNKRLNAVISDISPRLTGRYDTDQAISLELSTMSLEVASKLLSPGGCFVTKVFQGLGIEGLVDAAKLRFASVGRFSPTASRSASSETYLVCQKRLVKNKDSKGSAMDDVRGHLSSIGIVIEDDDFQEEETKVGFRKIRKRD